MTWIPIQDAVRRALQEIQKRNGRSVKAVRRPRVPVQMILAIRIGATAGDAPDMGLDKAHAAALRAINHTDLEQRIQRVLVELSDLEELEKSGLR